MTCPHFFLNLRRLFDKYAVSHTEHDALVKSTTKIFSNFVAFSENPNFNCVMTSSAVYYVNYAKYLLSKDCLLYSRSSRSA